MSAHPTCDKLTVPQRVIAADMAQAASEVIRQAGLMPLEDWRMAAFAEACAIFLLAAVANTITTEANK